MTITLDRITLVAMGSTQVDGMLEALKKSCQRINWGAVKLITDAKVDTFDSVVCLDEDGTYSINKMEVVPTEPITSIDEWNKRIIYELPRHITTDFALLIHADGYVVRPDSFQDSFLEYDYTGAPWPLPSDSYSYRDESGEIVRVGNSVSLRSKKLMDLVSTREWKSYHGNTNEDGFICCHNRKWLESQGCKFAPLEVAVHFGKEHELPEHAGLEPFTFHSL